MKKNYTKMLAYTLSTAAMLGIISGCANQAAQPSVTSYDPSGLIHYMEENPTTWMSVNNGNWSENKEDQPTDEELILMLDTAMKAQLGVQYNEVFCVVLRDYEDQFDIIGDYWSPESVTEGTVTVLFYTDQLLPQEQHLSPYGVYIEADGTENPAGSRYVQMPELSILDTGITMGWLQFAAHSLGYNTHVFAGLYGEGALNSPTKYVDGKNLYRGWGFVHEYGEDIKDIPLDGNLKLLSAIVIGKPAKGIDAVSAASMHMRPSNYSFYDGIPGKIAEVNNNAPADTTSSATNNE